MRRCLCVYTSMCAHVYPCTLKCVRMHVCVPVCAHVCTSTRTAACMHTREYVCGLGCDCTPECVRVHMYYTRLRVRTHMCVCMCVHARNGPPSEESLEGTLLCPASRRVPASGWDQEQRQPALAPCALRPRRATPVLALASACSLGSP